MVSGPEVDLSRTGLDASSLRLGGGGGGLCGHDVGRGLVLPGRRAGWLGERRHGLAGETFPGLPCRMLVAILQEELGDEVGVDADGAVLAWQHPGAGSEAVTSAIDCPASGIT